MHGPIGTYEYRDDNAPLEMLAKNDVILQKQVDSLYAKLKDNLDSDFTRADFMPLRPSVGDIETELYVSPGSFACRMPTRSGPMWGGKSLGSGINSARGGLEGDRRIADTAALTESHNMGESQRTSIVFFRGGGVKFDSWTDADFNWKRTDNYEQEPDDPDHRMDLVCVQGFPAGDQFGEQKTILGASSMSWLVVVKGAGFRNTPLFNDDGEPVFSNALSTGRYKDEDIRITMTKSVNPYIDPDFDRAADTGVSKYRFSLANDDSKGLLTARTYGMGKTSIENMIPGRPFGTIPAPDDILNSSYHQPGGLDENWQAILSSTQNITDVNMLNSNKVGLFTVPIAYVKIPKGYAGTRVENSWIQDIRPLFRTTELTLSERQAISNGYRAQASNRFMTIMDSEYQYLVNYILQEDQWNRFDLLGQRDISIGNHEGRIQAMEACIDRPKLQAAPTYHAAGHVPDVYRGYPYPYYHIPSWADIYGAGPILAHSGSSMVRGGIPRFGGMYGHYGQFIPCVRSYMDRFYTTSYNCKKLAAIKYGNGQKQIYAYGTVPSKVRRLQIRKTFLTYNANDITTTKYPSAGYRDNFRPNPNPQCFWKTSPAKFDDSMLTPHSRYKFQQVEVDLVFPSFDPERDAVEECNQVWQESHHDGLGWSGFGHGGSRTDTSKWVTVCNTYGGDETVQNAYPQWSVPLGVVPYYVDCDALGFVQGLVDTLNIELINLVDTANDRGMWTHYRFNARSPRWNGINEWSNRDLEEIDLGHPDDKYLSLDERSGTVPTGGAPGWTWGAVGEHQTWEIDGSESSGRLLWKYKAQQISPGYSGFCIFVHMPILTRTEYYQKESHGFFGHLHNIVSHFRWNYSHTHSRQVAYTGYMAKRAKIKISGPAHRYLNGAYLPSPANSDQGGANNTAGALWID